MAGAFKPTLVEDLPAGGKPLATGGPGDHDSDMLAARVTKLEAAVESLKHSFDNMRWMIALLATVTLAGLAFFGAQITRVDNKLDSLNGKVNALPAQISSDLRDLTNTLANSITAARSAPTQVILVPAPEARPPGK